MNNRQISALLNSNNVVANVFRGVFPRDANVKREVGAYVFNTDKTGEPGTHWVVAIINSDSRNQYFDSYGLPPLFEEFETFLQPSYYYNDYCFQQLHTAVCGHYCVYYVTQYARGFTHQQIMELLSHKKQADIYVALFIEQTFFVNLKIFDIPYVKKQICQMRSNFLQQL